MPVYVPRGLAALTAAVSVLRADPQLETWLGDRIYTQAPPDIQLPLLTLLTEERPWATTETGDGVELTMSVIGYSAQAGLLEVTRIVARAVERLTEDAVWEAVSPGPVATCAGIDRPYAADLDGRLLTVQEGRVVVRWPG